MVVPSTITKWLRLVPMSNHEPVLCTRLKNMRPRISQNSCKTFMTRPKLQPLNQIIWMKNRETHKNGIKILMSSKPPIKKGLKTATKHLMEEGSKLFKLAMFPVAKNE